jgi:hypothetical protein
VKPLYCMRCDVGEAQARCTCNDVGQRRPSSGGHVKPHFRLHVAIFQGRQRWYILAPHIATHAWSEPRYAVEELRGRLANDGRPFTLENTKKE